MPRCLVLLLAIAMGCTPLTVPPRPLGSPPTAKASPERCATLDDRATYGTAFAAGAGVVSGLGNVGSIAMVDDADPNRRLTLAITALGFAAAAATAAVIGHQSAARFTAECTEPK